MINIYQYEIFWVNLEPSVGGEMKKIRPYVIISPSDMNKGLATVVVVPLTNTVKDYLPFRITIRHKDVMGQMALDHIKSVDKTRLRDKIGKLNVLDIAQLKLLLSKIFVE